MATMLRRPTNLDIALLAHQDLLSLQTGLADAKFAMNVDETFANLLYLSIYTKEARDGVIPLCRRLPFRTP